MQVYIPFLSDYPYGQGKVRTKQYPVFEGAQLTTVVAATPMMASSFNFMILFLDSTFQFLVTSSLYPDFWQ